MQAQVELISLPPQLARLVEAGIRAFVDEHQMGSEHDPYLRWHGADQWMVRMHMPDDPEQPRAPGSIERRITIAAYSDAPDDLVILPDLLVTAPSARYVLVPPIRTEFVRRLSVFHLTRLLLLGTSEPGGLETKVQRALDHAWESLPVTKLLAAFPNSDTWTALP